MDAKLEARDAKGSYGVARVDAVGRRWYTQRFKSELVAQCLRPGASVSKISIEHGLNTNLVRKWITRVQREAADVAPLLPVVLAEPSPSERLRDQQTAIEIRIGKAVIAIDASAPAQHIEAIVRALR